MGGEGRGGAIKYDARRTKKEHNETCGGREEIEGQRRRRAQSREERNMRIIAYVRDTMPITASTLSLDIRRRRRRLKLAAGSNVSRNQCGGERALESIHWLYFVRVVRDQTQMVHARACRPRSLLLLLHSDPIPNHRSFVVSQSLGCRLS